MRDRFFCRVLGGMFLSWPFFNGWIFMINGTHKTHYQITTMTIIVGVATPTYFIHLQLFRGPFLVGKCVGYVLHFMFCSKKSPIQIPSKNPSVASPCVSRSFKDLRYLIRENQWPKNTTKRNSKTWYIAGIVAKKTHHPILCTYTNRVSICQKILGVQYPPFLFVIWYHHTTPSHTRWD